MVDRLSSGGARALPAPTPSARRGERWLQRLACEQLEKSWLFLALGLVATLLGLWSCSRLSLRTRFEDLLPESSASVVELRRLLRETERGAQMYVLLEGAPRAHLRSVADAVAGELRAADGVRSAESGVHEARRFLLPRRGLFADVPALERVDAELRAQLSWAIGEALGLNLADAPRPLDVEGLVRELLPAEASALAARFPDGYFEDAAGSAVVVVVETRVADGDLSHARALVDEVQARTRRLLARPGHAAVQARYAGNLVTGLAEYGAAARDLLDVGALGVGLVLAVVMLYFMRWRVLALLAMVVVAGLAWTFGLAALIFGHVNLASGALVSLVAGSSVNHGIIFLARYFEERTRGATAGDAIGTAHATTFAATLTAALAGAAAYGCLAAGDFPLLDHFAVVGALGMLLCWVATALLLGPALACLERWHPLLARAPGRGVRYERPFLVLVSRFARPIALAGATLTVLGLIASVGYASAWPTEHDMRRLQNDRGSSEALYAASYRCAEILGAALESSMLVLADRPEQVPALVHALEARRDEAAPGERPFEAVHSLQALVPADQPRKLELLGSIRETLLRGRPHLDPELWRRLEPLLPPAELEPIGLDTLPAALAAPFTDRHGVRGRIVLIEPAAGQSDSDLIYLMRWADAFRETRLPSGEVVHGSGRAVVFADMLRAVEDATPRTLSLALGMTTLVLALFFRGSRETWVAFAALLGGLGWLGGLMSVADVKLNFMNFIALPVTFGIAVDYPVNFLARLRSEPDANVLAALRGTGGAIILCSATTLLGYGALLASDNQAIRSLGLLCVMGELCCVTAATLVLPSVMLSLQRWRGRTPATSADGGADTKLPRTRCREV